MRESRIYLQFGRVTLEVTRKRSLKGILKNPTKPRVFLRKGAQNRTRDLKQVRKHLLIAKKLAKNQREEKMTISSSFLPKLLLHTADYTAQSANNISFPLKLESNPFPLSFIRSGWLINHLPRQVPFPFIYSFIHASIHSKDICWVYLPKSELQDLYYYFYT